MNHKIIKNLFNFTFLLLIFTSCNKDVESREEESEEIELIEETIDITDLSLSKAFTNPMDTMASPNDIVRIILYSDGAEPQIVENDQCSYVPDRVGNSLNLAFTGNMHGDTIKDGLYLFNHSNLPDDSEYTFNFFNIRLDNPVLPGRILTGRDTFRLNGEIEITTDQNLKKMNFDLKFGNYIIKGKFEGPMFFCW